MKKVLLLTAMAVIALQSCTVKEYYEEYYDCPDGHLISDTYYIKVLPSAWKTLNANGDFYIYAAMNLPAINTNVIDNGIVLAYYIDDYDNLLPYVRSYNTNNIEIIRYDITAGEITFIIENHESTLPPFPTGEMEFKVVVARPVYH
jgi:hypothetical protein